LLQAGLKESEKFSALNVSVSCWLLLLVKVGWQQGKTSGNGEGSVMGIGVVGIDSTRTKLRLLDEF